MITHFIFYAFAVVAVISAYTVITAKNPVRSVLALVVTFFAVAAIWMMLYAEFLSLILLLVYVGAVMTLFLFVVMMLQIQKEQKGPHFVRYFPFGLLVVVLLMGILIVSEIPRDFKVMPHPMILGENANNTAQLGAVLFTHYLYPFEVAGVLLLAAIIAAIALTHRRPINRKSQNISEQVSTHPESRIKLLKTIAYADEIALSHALHASRNDNLPT